MLDTKIDEKKQILIDSMLRGDSELYSTVYGCEGQILMEGGLVIEGPDNIKNQIESFMGLLGPMNLKLSKKDRWPEKEYVYESGHFQYNYLNANEPFYTGTYVYIWKVLPDGEVILYRNVSIDD